MTRRSHALDELEPDAFVCINGEDLTVLGANIGEELRVASRRGTITAKARLDNSLPAGTIFMPFCCRSRSEYPDKFRSRPRIEQFLNTNMLLSESNALARGTDRQRRA